MSQDTQRQSPDPLTPMNVLGIELTGDLADFYAKVEALYAEDGLALTCEAGDGPEYGGFFRGEGAARVEVRRDLPPDAMRHTLAHELVHGLQRREGWPRAEANSDLGDDSSADEVAAMLQAIVHCTAAELRIAPLGLDGSWEQDQRHQAVRTLIRTPHPGADEEGTAAWAYWSLLYAYISLLHPPEHSRTLLHNIERALPAAGASGREAAALVRQHGYATREQALAAMLAVQEAMALAPDVLVEDPRDGAVYGEDPGDGEMDESKDEDEDARPSSD